MLDVRRILLLITAFVATMSISCSGVARAYAPEVAEAIALRVAEALPLDAQWDPSWTATVAADIALDYEYEDRDAEAAAPLHRHGAGRDVSHPADLDPADVGRVSGRATYALAEARAALRDAFAHRQAARIVKAIGRLAVSAADLADPFLVTPLEALEVPGARAQFSDLFDLEELSGLGAQAVVEVTDARMAALDLANASAALRGTIEEAARASDVLRLAALRRERIEAAIALAQGLAIVTWREAGSPSLAGAAPRAGLASVWPNPTRGATSVSFTLPSAGEASVEVFDVNGRRVWTGVLGRLPAGPSEVQLGERTIRSLPAGLFLVRVRTAAHEALGRMLRLRN